MARTDTLQGALDLLILKVLDREAPLYGYAVMNAIKRLSGDVLRVEEGSLYPALHRLTEEGLIEGSWVTKESGHRSRVYQLTTAGKKRLANDTERWAEVSGAILNILRMA